MSSRYYIVTVLLSAGVALLLMYQNCGQEKSSSQSSLSSSAPIPSIPSYTPFDPNSLAPACLGSHTVIINIDDQPPASGPSGKQGSPGQMRARQSVEDDAPIDLMIDNSFYDIDPSNPLLVLEFMKLVEGGIKIWEDGIGIDIFNLIQPVQTGIDNASVTGDGHSTIYWNKKNHYPPTMSINPLAFACTMFGYSGRFIESDVVVNDYGNRLFFDCLNDCPFESSLVQEAFYKKREELRSSGQHQFSASHFSGIMAHELGHVLGFGHSDGDNKSIMKPVFQSYEVIDKLSEKDIERYFSLKDSVRTIKR